MQGLISIQLEKRNQQESKKIGDFAPLELVVVDAEWSNYDEGSNVFVKFELLQLIEFCVNNPILFLKESDEFKTFKGKNIDLLLKPNEIVLILRKGIEKGVFLAAFLREKKSDLKLPEKLQWDERDPVQKILFNFCVFYLIACNNK
jgi:hypothetical protein